MTYEDVKDKIKNKLEEYPEGLTWLELKTQLQLPYDQFCPEWTQQLETEIGLDRTEKKGRALLWRVPC